jgi:hypothetical protein
MIRFSGLFLLLVSFAGVCCGQAKRSLAGTSWIKREVYALPQNTRLDDTAYTRYTFQKNIVYISFEPAWNTRYYDWNIHGNQLKMAYVEYDIEAWTDSTLIIFEPGGRRFVLENEDWLRQKAPAPPVLGVFNNEPLYATTAIVTPRYKGSSEDVSKKNLELYDIRNAITFEATFVVKADGTIDSFGIVHGIVQGFDYEVYSQLKKTSKHWTPAMYQGRPIQTLMVYTIKYLDSHFRH